MSQAKTGDTVKVHYTGKLTDGTVFDSSTGGEPMEFRIGGGQVIGGFEAAVVGLAPGESATAQIASGDAYGPHRVDMVVEVERSRFPEHIAPKIGDRLQLKQSEDQSLLVTVTAVGAQTVTLDANHPLAGQDLTFEIELVSIS